MSRRRVIASLLLFTVAFLAAPLPLGWYLLVLVWAFAVAQTWLGRGTSLGRTCRVCGCTDRRACPGGCWWAAVPGRPLCTRCAACTPETVWDDPKTYRIRCSVHGDDCPRVR